MIKFHVNEKAMSTIEGSTLYQQPHLLDTPDEREANYALHNCKTRNCGRGRTNVIRTTFGAAEVIRQYCEDVGSAFLLETGSDPDQVEARADGRALLTAAAKARAALQYAGGVWVGDQLVPPEGYADES